MRTKSNRSPKPNSSATSTSVSLPLPLSGGFVDPKQLKNQFGLLDTHMSVSRPDHDLGFSNSLSSPTDIPGLYEMDRAPSCRYSEQCLSSSESSTSPKQNTQEAMKHLFPVSALADRSLVLEEPIPDLRETVGKVSPSAHEEDERYSPARRSTDCCRDHAREHREREKVKHIRHHVSRRHSHEFRQRYKVAVFGHEGHKKIDITRKDMRAFVFGLVPLPVVALVISLLFLTAGSLLLFYGIYPIAKYGSHQSLSPMVLGQLMLGIFNVMVGLGGLMAARPPCTVLIAKRRHTSRVKLLTQWLQGKSKWRSKGLHLLKIGMSTVILCLTVHFLSVQALIVQLITLGRQTVTGEFVSWWPTSHEVGEIIAYDCFYVGMLLFYLGAMNCIRSLSRRFTAAKNTRATALKVWGRSIGAYQILEMASQESIDNQCLSIDDSEEYLLRSHSSKNRVTLMRTNHKQDIRAMNRTHRLPLEVVPSVDSSREASMESTESIESSARSMEEGDLPVFTERAHRH